MSKRISLHASLLLFVIVFVTACATTPPPAAPASPTMRYLIDPRIGFTGESTSAQQRRFDSAWITYQSGNFAEAQRLFDAMLASKSPYLPAKLGLAAIALEQKDFDKAQAILDQVSKAQSIYYAADVYRAELDARRGRLEAAYNLYGGLVNRTQAPEVLRSRYGDIANQLYESLVAHAGSDASVERSVAYLRQALLVRPDASATRLVLAQKLITLGKYEDARKQLQPLVDANEMPLQTQEALVDIDVGTGRYEDAIARLERLDRTNPDPRYSARLEQIKTTWAEANLPAQYHQAIGAGAITRADLAVLIFWKITAVRFAQNLPEPPIATDIGGVIGREELVRAMALRLFNVDAVTRTVGPERLVSATAFMRTIAKVTQFRGATCAAAARGETNDASRALKIFDSCSLPTGDLLASQDAPVSGEFAAQVLDRVERLPNGR